MELTSFWVDDLCGNASNGGYCGLAYLNSNNGVGNANANYGGRLYFATQSIRPESSSYSYQLITVGSKKQDSRPSAGAAKQI